MSVSRMSVRISDGVAFCMEGMAPSKKASNGSVMSWLKKFLRGTSIDIIVISVSLAAGGARSQGFVRCAARFACSPSARFACATHSGCGDASVAARLADVLSERDVLSLRTVPRACVLFTYVVIPRCLSTRKS